MPSRSASLFTSRRQPAQVYLESRSPCQVAVTLTLQPLSGRRAHVPQPLDSARNVVAARSPVPIPTSVPIPLGERTKRVFQGSAAEADRLHHTEIGLVHLLLGVLREPHSIATGFLEKHGLRAPAIRDAIAALRKEQS